MKEKTLELIQFWHDQLKKKALPRTSVDQIELNPSVIRDIIGVRRCGKSSLFPLLMQANKIESEQCLMMNFEDPFFIVNQGPEIIDELIETYLHYFSDQLKYLFFDEIQALEGWERSIRKIHSQEKYAIVLTGSSSKMLSREISTLLTGRHKTTELSPLSFKEFLLFRGLEIESFKDLVLSKAILKKQLEDYMVLGGFPKVVLERDTALLKQYFYDILHKDIAFRHQVREKELLEKISVFLLSNAAKPYSIASLKRAFGSSHEVISNYIEYCKEAFLVFELPKFSFSLKTQMKSAKKLYAIDAGLAQAVSFQFSKNKGRLLENILFHHLRGVHEALFYHRESHECDFLGASKGKVEAAYQVCYEVNEENVKREEQGLLEACQKHGLKRGLVVTLDQEKIYKKEGVEIIWVPAWKFLLGFLPE